MTSGVAIIHAAAVENQCSVQHRAVAFFGRFRFIQEIARLLDVETIDLSQLVEGVSIATMVGMPVIAIRGDHSYWRS